MKAAALTRKIPNTDGNFTTYMSVAETSRLLGLDDSSLARWAQAGAVRRLEGGIGNAKVFIAVIDAIRIKLTPRKQLIENGILLTPPERLKYLREKNDEYQSRTQPAPRNYEVWEVTEIDLLIRELEKKTQIVEIAERLGRTYAATWAMIERLVKCGDIDRVVDAEDDSWKQSIRYILNDHELALLEEVL